MRLPAPADEGYVAHLYVIRHDDRDGLSRHLAASAIQTDVHYPVPDHRQDVHGEDSPVPKLPVTEEACATVLTLPCYPGLRRDDQDAVIAAVRSFTDARES
jgi:dTDP-4-amino-4,6-dideoxygalactose transaminase